MLLFSNLKQIFVVSLLLTFLPKVVAQQNLSLKACIDTAFANNADIISSLIEIENSTLDIKKAKAAYYPTLNANINHTIHHNDINSLDFDTYDSYFLLYGSTTIFDWFTLLSGKPEI